VPHGIAVIVTPVGGSFRGDSWPIGWAARRGDRRVQLRCDPSRRAEGIQRLPHAPGNAEDVPAAGVRGQLLDPHA